MYLKMDGGRPSNFILLEIDTLSSLLPICQVLLLGLDKLGGGNLFFLKIK